MILITRLHKFPARIDIHELAINFFTTQGEILSTFVIRCSVVAKRLGAPQWITQVNDTQDGYKNRFMQRE